MVMANAPHPEQICILGGGFGGLYTALRLAQLPWSAVEVPPEITLVDHRDRFVFAPLLYEVVTDELATWEIAPPYAELLAGTAVRFRQSAVAGVDPEAKQVTLADGSTLSYTHLVLGLGGTTSLDWVPGAADHALPFRTLDDAYRLRERLRLLDASEAEKIRVAIIGGGYSGVELACKLAERLGERGRLRIIERTDSLLRTSPEHNRTVAQQTLSDLGVWLDLDTTVDAMTADSLTLIYRDQQDTLPVDLVLWTVGTQVNPVMATLPVEHNERQQIVVQPTLEVTGQSGIYALGDGVECKDADGQLVPPTAQAAMQQADYAAWNVWAAICGRPQLPFRYQHLGEMLTLGSERASLTGLGLQLEGELAHLARRLTYLYRMPTLSHQVRVGLNWMTKPLRDLLTS